MRIFRTAAIFALVAAGLLPATAQEPKKSNIETKEIPVFTAHGRTALGLPKPTEAGNWHGTWIYLSRDHKFALWLDESGERPIAKVRYQGNGNIIEGFETDWEGRADYIVQDLPAVFDLELTDVGDDRLAGSWLWDLDLRGSARRESGELDIYRTGDGRQLVLHFTKFQRVIETGGQTIRHDAPQAWTFRKLSRRLALWEELPF